MSGTSLPFFLYSTGSPVPPVASGGVVSLLAFWAGGAGDISPSAPDTGLAWRRLYNQVGVDVRPQSQNDRTWMRAVILEMLAEEEKPVIKAKQKVKEKKIHTVEQTLVVKPVEKIYDKSRYADEVVSRIVEAEKHNEPFPPDLLRFLAIFRERLEQARERQAELIRQRDEEAIMFLLAGSNNIIKKALESYKDNPLDEEFLTLFLM